MKRFLLGTFATIVGMFALTSCDKDELIISNPQPIFFKIVDASHIDLYDQGENIYETGRDVEFKIAQQMTQNCIETTPLQPLEELDIEIDPFEMKRSGNAIVVRVEFNHFTNTLKVFGLHIEGEDALGNKFDVACLSNVFIHGEIVVEETRESPFLQAGHIHYQLYTLKKGEPLILAETDQEFRICEDLSDIEF